MKLVAGSTGLARGTSLCHPGPEGGRSASPMGMRGMLLRRLAHTLGADAVIGAAARDAWRVRNTALVECRSVVLCARGRVRSGGRGLVRLSQHECSIVLEFDRGTVHTAVRRGRLAADHRYRTSALAAHDCDGVPTVLVVASRPDRVERLAQAIRAALRGQAAREHVLVTTEALATTRADAFFSATWRDANASGVWRWTVKPQEVLAA